MDIKNENKVVFGIFKDRMSLENAVEQLKASGFRNADISALLPSTESTKEFAHDKETKMPEGATTGAVSGAVLGGTLGWLAGIGSIAIPGLGPFIAAGPIMGLLAGAGTGGALGGITGALVGMGMPEYVAQRYEGSVKKGGYLLSVHADNHEWQERAHDILESTGATDISECDEAASDTDESTERDIPHERRTF